MSQNHKISLNKKLVIVAIIVAAFDIFLLYFVNYYLPPQNDITLSIFDFGNLNKYFQSTGNKIIMHSGHGFLAPNDELAVSFNFFNEYNERVEVITTLIKQIGDQPASQQLGDYIVTGNTTDHQSYVFHVSGEGENDIRFVLTLKNSTTQQFIQNLTTTTIPLTVESVSSKLQEQANAITLSALIVSGIIGGVTVFALIKTNMISEKHTLELIEQNDLLRNQNDFIQKQASEHNRPWIGHTGGIKSVAIINGRNETKSLDEWSKLSQPEKDTFDGKTMDWNIILKNYGNIPALNVLVREYVAGDRASARKGLESTNYGNPFVIMPNSEHSVILTLPLNTSLEMLNPTIKTFTCIEIKYNSSNSIEDKIFGLTYERTATGLLILETWDEKSLIK